MLRRVGQELNSEGAKLPIREADFPAPFKAGLEYSSPARGTWNIVHTGMLIPEAHQIFVCAVGCLRGVVLTAAEMNALDRYSAIQIREENVLDGGMEELMIDGVADVLSKLKYRPRAILLFISCQHFFLAYDKQLVLRTLRDRFPDIKFTECYMIPTLRKSGLTPDQKMRIQLYSMWEKREPKKKVNLIGSNLRTSPTSELVRMVEDAGYEFWDLYRCKDFDDYLAMAEAELNIVYEPIAIPSAEELKERLGQEYLYMSFSFDFEELEQNYQNLADLLGVVKPDFTEAKEKAEAAMHHAREVIKDTPVAVDYSFTFRIVSFARMLLEYGFNVKEIYADAFAAEDEADFEWIKEHYPEIVISSTNRPKMRYLYHSQPRGDTKTEQGATGAGSTQQDMPHVLAVGQKAAYFSETDYFVNVAESGGFYGFDGICQIAGLMEDAFYHKKDRKSIIQKKGYGCESCI